MPKICNLLPFNTWNVQSTFLRYGSGNNFELNPQVLDQDFSYVVSDFGQVSILSVAHEKKTSDTQSSGHNSRAIILWFMVILPMHRSANVLDQ